MGLGKTKCPRCGDLLLAQINMVPKPATSFKDCLRRCEKCGIGFSNGQSNPTIIYENYCDNVPEQLRSGLSVVLRKTLNLKNQDNKIIKFGFSTSEDALTWSFFKYFVVYNRFEELLRFLSIDSKDSIFDIYLWGVNICSSNNDSKFLDNYFQVSDSFKEDCNKRTEPDVMIKLSNQVIFIEVKYCSSNLIINDRAKFDKYKVSDVNLEKVKDSGCYELFRNWAFASKLSNRSQFILINLGLNRLFSDKNQHNLHQFEESLCSDNGRFKKLSWENILSEMKRDYFDDWFIDYLEQKINIAR